MCFVDTSFIPELKVDINTKIYLSSYNKVIKKPYSTDYLITLYLIGAYVSCYDLFEVFKQIRKISSKYNRKANKNFLSIVTEEAFIY